MGWCVQKEYEKELQSLIYLKAWINKFKKQQQNTRNTSNTIIG